MDRSPITRRARAVSGLALAAVALLVERTFGRWQVAPDPAAARGRPDGEAGDVGRSSVLVEALAGRLALRGVEVRLASRVLGVGPGPGGVSGVRTAEALEPADAVVLAVDPWTAAGLAPAAAALSDLSAKEHVPRLMSAMLPAGKPLQSASVQPSAPVGAASTAVALPLGLYSMTMLSIGPSAVDRSPWSTWKRSKVKYCRSVW